MPAFRAASLREAPSKIDASAKSRRDWFASRTRRALWRNSSADQSVRVILMAIRSPKANQPLHRITAATSWEPSAEESENLTLGIMQGYAVDSRSSRFSSLRHEAVSCEHGRFHGYVSDRGRVLGVFEHRAVAGRICAAGRGITGRRLVAFSPAAHAGTRLQCWQAARWGCKRRWAWAAITPHGNGCTSCAALW